MHCHGASARVHARVHARDVVSTFIARARCLGRLLAARALPLWVALAIACVAATPKAWDADRMIAAAQRLGPHAVSSVHALRSALSAVQNADELTQLNALNQFFNRRIEFRDDSEVWSRHDYWASPLESLARGQGDCEDFAIAKYFSLLALGMPPAKLRMVYVRARLGGPGGQAHAHMVLAFYATPAAEPLILDNLISELRPASRRPDLEPVFSFNSNGLWQGMGAQSAGDPAARLSRWREVLAKARGEGFR
jgi:predicted transglutaminase-like cysteine proteinase